MYKHEVDKPSEPAKGRVESGMGCDDYKGQAMDQAFGQAGKSGCAADMKKIRAQFMNYSWSDSENSGY